MVSLATVEQNLREEGIHPEQMNQPALVPHESHILESIAEHPLTQSVLGAGDVLRGTMANWLNKIPGVNVPNPHFGEGTAYQIGRGLGDLGSYSAMAALAPAGVAGRIGAGTAYGAITNPSHPFQGALEGGLTAGGFEAAPALLGKVSSTKFAKDIGQKLTDLVASKKQESRELYRPVFEPYGENLIQSLPKSHYLHELDEDLLKRGDVKRLHKAFMEYPTIQHAHNLQSQLGKLERSAKSKDLSVGEEYGYMKNALSKDIQEHLEKYGGSEAKNAYLAAQSHYAQEVAPFEKKSVEKILRASEEGNANQIHKILSSMKKRPEELETLRTGLARRLMARHIAKTAGGAGLGYLIGSEAGAPPTTDALLSGLLASLGAGSSLYGKLARYSGTSGIGRALPLARNLMISTLIPESQGQ